MEMNIKEKISCYFWNILPVLPAKKQKNGWMTTVLSTKPGISRKITLLMTN
jgi:hypothetical protein